MKARSLNYLLGAMFYIYRVKEFFVYITHSEIKVGAEIALRERESASILVEDAAKKG